MASDQKPPEGLDEISHNLKKLKRPLHGLAAFISGGGILLALILVFLVNDAIDKVQVLMFDNIDQAYKTVEDIETTVGVVESEIDTLGDGMEGIDQSLSHLSDGIEEGGITIAAVGNELGVLSILGQDFSQYSQDLNHSGEQLILSSKSLREAGNTVGGSVEGLTDLKNGISDIKQDITSHKIKLAESKNQLKSTFDKIKLANIILFLLIIVMLGVPLINSIAGII